MYNEEYDEEQEKTSEGSFIKNFYYNNKILIWIFIGVVVFILLMSLLTRGGSSGNPSTSYEVTIYPEGTLEISFGTSKKLVAMVTNDADATITWTSSDENIVKVDNGTVTGVNYGKATVTAIYNSSNNKKYEDTKEIIVADGNPELPLTDVSFKDGDLLMPPNGTYDIKLAITPSNGYVANKEFTSSNTSVVTVDNKGTVNAVGEGEATISLNVNNGSFRRNLKVYVNREYTNSEIIVNPTKIQIDGQLRKIKVGMSDKLSYTVFPADVDKTKLTWTSSDTSVVTVDNNGIVRGLKEGQAVVTLKSITGVKDTIDIEVESDIVEVTDISVPLNDLYLNVGQSQTITPTVSPDNASNKALSYVSGDNSIISVIPNETGISATVIGVRAGVTILTIKSSNNVEKRLNIIVSDSSSGGDSSGGSSSGGSSSPSSTQGFRISSLDANNGKFITTSYESTKPANNGATAPVTVTLEITDSKVASLRVAECAYPTDEATCNPSTSSSNVHVIYGSGSFTMKNTGAYVLRVGVYDSNNNLIRIVDKYIWIKDSSQEASITGGYDVVRMIDEKSLSTSEILARNNAVAPTLIKFVINNSDIKSIKACWAKGTECKEMNYTFTSTSPIPAKLSQEGLWIVNFVVTYKDNTTKKEKRYIYIESNSSGGSSEDDSSGGTDQKTTPTVSVSPTTLSMGVGQHKTYQVKVVDSVPGTFYNTISNSCVRFYEQDFSKTEVNGSYRKFNVDYGIDIAGVRPCSNVKITVKFVPTDTTKYNEVTNTVVVNITNL